MRRATSGAAGPIIPLPANVVIAKEGQVAKVDAPPGEQLVTGEMFSHLARREVTCRSHATKGSSNSSKASSNLPTARLEVASIFFQKDQQHLKAWQRAVWRVEDQTFSRSPTEHHSGHSTLGFHSLTLSCLLIDFWTPPHFASSATALASTSGLCSPPPRPHYRDHRRLTAVLLRFLSFVHHLPDLFLPPTLRASTNKPHHP